jgi:3-hydroxybutyryl-CoA dehydrogenase
MADPKFAKVAAIPVFRAMAIFIIADDAQRAELSGGKAIEGIQWIADPSALPDAADMVIDLQFVQDAARVERLRKCQAQALVVSSVTEKLDAGIIRICGWTTFLQGPVIEAAGGNETARKAAEEVFELFGKTVAWLNDEPGFITPRVISGIINEAYFALSEGVSDKASIDTALQLGTNYPYGPFAWSEKIGLKKVAELLTALSKAEARYAPAALMLSEVSAR